MKILQISPQVSYPPDNGGRLSIWGITKSLSERGHQITFICYSQGLVKTEIENELLKICKPVFIKWDNKNKLGTALLNLFSIVPYNISKYYSKKLECFLIDYFKHNKVDVVHVDHLHMAWVVDVIRKISDVPVILREHNLEMKIMKRYSEEQSNLFLRYYAKLQYWKFLKYEPKQCEKFNCCFMITEDDEKSLVILNPKIKTTVIPAGVDKEIFDIQSSVAIPYSIFHVGELNWEPNYDGLIWFLTEVYQKIVEKYPDSQLYVYSKGVERLKIPNNIKKNVVLCGYVKNIWEEILDKQILVVPLKVGSGMRVKIVEMLAAKKLIVTTTIGKEGIDVTDGEHILVADSSESFILKLFDIFENRIDIDNITRNAQNIIKKKYSWDLIAEKLEIEYNKTINKIRNYS